VTLLSGKKNMSLWHRVKSLTFTGLNTGKRKRQNKMRLIKGTIGTAMLGIVAACAWHVEALRPYIVLVICAIIVGIWIYTGLRLIIDSLTK